MFYTINNSFVDDFFNEVLTTKPVKKPTFTNTLNLMLR